MDRRQRFHIGNALPVYSVRWLLPNSCPRGAAKFGSSWILWLPTDFYLMFKLLTYLYTHVSLCVLVLHHTYVTCAHVFACWCMVGSVESMCITRDPCVFVRLVCVIFLSQSLHWGNSLNSRWGWQLHWFSWSCRSRLLLGNPTVNPPLCCHDGHPVLLDPLAILIVGFGQKRLVRKEG